MGKAIWWLALAVCWLLSLAQPACAGDLEHTVYVVKDPVLP